MVMHAIRKKEREREGEGERERERSLIEENEYKLTE